MRARFWIETALGTLSGALFLLTILWRSWIEVLTGFDPDHRNGSLELLIAVALLALAVVIAEFARRDYKHLRYKLQLDQQ